MKTKYFSPLFGLATLALGFAGADYSHAIPTSNSDELYSDSLYIERASAEIPGSFESSARNDHALAQEALTDEGADRSLESMNDLEDETPVKKVNTRKAKRSSKN